jgi:hypothetical protein
MKTVGDILRDADPLRHDTRRFDAERSRLRQVVVAAASDRTLPSSGWLRTPVALLASVALIVVGIGVGSQIWSRGSGTLQAAIRFEVRLAEDHAAAGLSEVRITGADRVIYLHQEVVVTNGDIAQGRVVEGDGPAHFGVSVQFNAAGTQKMRQATADHVGKPVAILIDGNVIAAPVLRSAIGTSALINGDFTRAEAERIVNGIGLR